MFSFKNILEYQSALYAGKITCVDIVDYYLHQIEANSHLNAFLEVYATEAKQRAIQLDEKRKKGDSLGKLHGVVISIKDVIAICGHRLSAASNILVDYLSPYNSTAVEKLLAAGAIIIGRNNCDEFAMGSSNENSAFGNVLNAIDPSRVPGGSSGGSAVAVQAGMCMASLGSDTGGSVRQPADFCGIVGLKPTYGLISRYGLISYASSFDQIGIFTNNIEDNSLILDVIAGYDRLDSTSSSRIPTCYSSCLDKPKQYRFAYFKQAIEHDGIDPEIASTIRKYLNFLIEQGHTVEAIDFSLLEYVVPTYYILTTAEASSNLSRYDGVRYGYRTPIENIDIIDWYKETRSKGFGKEVQRRILLGTFVLSAEFYDAYYTKAQKVRRLLHNQTEDVFQKYDAILSPTVPTTAFKFGEKSDDPTQMYLADIFTVYANLVGIPAISIPLFKHTNSMPFGLQIMTKSFTENDLLNISSLLMHHK